MARDAEQGMHPAGQVLFEELLAIHRDLRRDLSKLQELVDEVSNGITPKELRASLKRLKTATELGRLRTGCLTYCRFVNGHHHLEDVALFPAVRRRNPLLAQELDRLQADHRAVAMDVRAVEDAAVSLAARETVEARDRLTQALRRLSDHLLAHLTSEEDIIGREIRGWSQWPLEI